MKTWIAPALIVTILLAGCGFSMAGFSAGDFIQSRVPSEIQEDRGLPERVAHNKSEETFRLWTNDQRRIADAWASNLEDSGKWLAFVDGFLYEGWEQFSPVLASMGPVGTLASFLGGWLLLKRPKDATTAEVESAKRKSFNEADRRGRELAVLVAESIKDGKLDEAKFRSYLESIEKSGAA
jgi:hypothetical protein